MIFHMPQKKVQLPLLQIAESNIEYVDNFNFLGITINKHLNWASHIDALASKISKTIGVLSSLKHILSIHILRTIYNSLIVCHLNYGVLVWGTQSNLNNSLIVCHLNYGVLVWGTQSNLNNSLIVCHLNYGVLVWGKSK